MNSNWNSRNDWKGVNELKRAKILKVDFDSQQPSIKQAIRSVPAIVVLKDGRPVATWQADLSFKINVPIEEIQKRINFILFEAK